jgi:F0F1-type ATP synthase alpha subunit
MSALDIRRAMAFFCDGQRSVVNVSNEVFFNVIRHLSHVDQRAGIGRGQHANIRIGDRQTQRGVILVSRVINFRQD